MSRPPIQTPEFYKGQRGSVLIKMSSVKPSASVQRQLTFRERIKYGKLTRKMVMQ
jgi:hypothetical protein